MVGFHRFTLLIICKWLNQSSHKIRRTENLFQLHQKMPSFFTAGGWEKDTIFGAAQINFCPFLFWQGFSSEGFHHHFMIVWKCSFYTFSVLTVKSRTMDTQWRHKSKISEKLGRFGRQNMLRPYLKIWDWDWILGRAVKAIPSLGVRSPCVKWFLN